jgi:hypothetical protein
MVVHKSHIPKVMLLAAVGIPQNRPDGTWFDGKVGIWPVQEPTTTLRSSVLRSAGTEVMKLVSFTAEMYLYLMTKEGGIIVAIREKLSCLKESGVVIQHDGASPHGGKNNAFHLASRWGHSCIFIDLRINVMTSSVGSVLHSILVRCFVYMLGMLRCHVG